MAIKTPEMSLKDAIYKRRSIRSFTPDTVDRTTIDMLLDAAVQAPTAMRQEPWSFVVIQDSKVLQRLSATGKESVIQNASKLPLEHRDRLVARAKDPDASLFYDAGTLIAIYGKSDGPFVQADCWLAAQNLMLMACSLDLGACVIGLAIEALNTPFWRTELGVPTNLMAYAAIIVGVPRGEIQPISRKKPEILRFIGGD